MKPGSRIGTSGEGVGDSALKPCMASNQPSSADGAACLLELKKQVSDTSQRSRPERSSLETATAVEASPFKSAEVQKNGIVGRKPTRKGGHDDHSLMLLSENLFDANVFHFYAVYKDNGPRPLFTAIQEA